MDLLYNNEQYDKILHVVDAMSEKQSELGGDKYPVACVTLAVAACHKLVSLCDKLTSIKCITYNCLHEDTCASSQITSFRC